MSADIPRIKFEALRPDLQALLAARVERLGYFGEFFQCAANQPGLLAPFVEMTEALNDALPKKLIEVGALTAARIMGSRYELNQHEQLCDKLGYGRDWIAEVERLDPQAAALMDPGEKAVQALVMALCRDRGKGVRDELHAAMDSLGPEAAVGVIFLAGRYAVHAMFVNGLELDAPVPSIFQEPARG